MLIYLYFDIDFIGLLSLTHSVLKFSSWTPTSHDVSPNFQVLFIICISIIANQI